MWIVKTINRDNITDIVEYVQEISKINDKDITLSLNSSLGFAETFLYLYEIMRVLLEKGILVKKGPQIIGNVVLINENVYKLKDFSLEDAVWWLVHSNNITCKEKISDEEKQDMIDIIRKSYGIQVKDLLCTYEKEQDRKAILLALGIALIIIYYTGFVSILKEVILMSGWLSICSSVYGLIFSSTQSFVKIKRLKNLSKARIYFN